MRRIGLWVGIFLNVHHIVTSTYVCNLAERKGRFKPCLSVLFVLDQLAMDSKTTSQITPLCNRPSGLFSFTQWNFSRPRIRLIFSFYAVSLWLPRCEFYIPSMYHPWKGQNSDPTERGNVVENRTTGWLFFFLKTRFYKFPLGLLQWDVNYKTFAWWFGYFSTFF